MTSVPSCSPTTVTGVADLIDVFRDSLSTADIFSKNGWDVGCKLLAPLLMYLEKALNDKGGITGKLTGIGIPYAVQEALNLVSKESGDIVTTNPTMTDPTAKSMNCQVLIWKAIKADVINSLASRKGSKASDIISYYQISASVLNDTSIVSLIVANIIAYLCFSVNVALPLPDGFSELSTAIQKIDSVATSVLAPTQVGFPLFAKHVLTQTEIEAITDVFKLLIPQQKGVPSNGFVVSLSVPQPNGKKPVSITLQNHQLNGPLGLRTAQSYVDPLVADVVYSNCKDGIFDGLPTQIDAIKDRYCSPTDNKSCNKSCAISPDSHGADSKGGSTKSGGKGYSGSPLPHPSHHKGMASWEIALIVIGSALIIAGITVGIVFSVKHHKKIEQGMLASSKK